MILSELQTAVNILNYLININDEIKTNNENVKRLISKKNLFVRIFDKLNDSHQDEIKADIINRLYNILSEIKLICNQYSEDNSNINKIYNFLFRTKQAKRMNEYFIALNDISFELNVLSQEDNHHEVIEDMKNLREQIKTFFAEELEDMNFKLDSIVTNTTLSNVEFKLKVKECNQDFDKQLFDIIGSLKQDTSMIIDNISMIMGSNNESLEYLRVILNNQIDKKDEETKKKLLQDIIIPEDSIKINLDQIIKKGKFDLYKVYRGSYNTNYVAIKIFKYPNQSIDFTEEFKYEMLLAKYFGKYCYHPNISHCYGYFLNKKSRMNIVFELAPYGSLENIIFNENSFSEIPFQLILSWLLDLTAALTFIHSKGIQHKDIRVENLLVFEGLKVKLCNFSYSSSSAESLNLADGMNPFSFLIPELKNNNGSSLATDMYAWALTVYQMVLRGNEFTRTDNNIEFTELLDSVIVKIEEKYRDRMKYLIQDCLNSEPKLRPQASAINNTLTNMRYESNLDSVNNLQSKIQEIESTLIENNKPKESKIINNRLLSEDIFLWFE